MFKKYINQQNTDT